MKRMFTAVMLATALTTGAALAQDAATEMGEGLSMLELAVTKEFARLGLKDVDAMSLSLSQLAEIKSVIGSSESNQSEMALQIQTIVERR